MKSCRNLFSWLGIVPGCLGVFWGLGSGEPLLGAERGPGEEQARLQPVVWSYTGSPPADGWEQPGFDDSAWNTGSSGFGTDGTPQARIGTEWSSSDIWLRRRFVLGELPARPALMVHYNDGAEVFLNGRKIAEFRNWAFNYEVIPLGREEARNLVVGENLLAVHAWNKTPGQIIDVHLVDANAVPRPQLLARRLRPLKPSRLTSWARKVTPENVWPEYPRPQLVRDDWTNLNGHWDHAVTPKDAPRPDDWAGRILVPFCIEAELSGVRRLLYPDEALWYRRSVELQPTDGRRILLHFEAVDHRCQVWLNDTRVGGHAGGFSPFTIELTGAAREGANELVVRVEDATSGRQLLGKQSAEPRGFRYTRVSGIWQTVWLEEVPDRHIRRLRTRSDLVAGTLTVEAELDGAARAGDRVRVRVRDGEDVIAEGQGAPGPLTLRIENPQPWSPENPHLYDLEIHVLDAGGRVGDRVRSYAGMRTVGSRRDERGNLRFTLNGKTVFHWGVLDQGWWPGGLLTPPSDEAMRYDIEFLKKAGFNMIHKSVKVEPRRFYHHCDRLGMLVWQEHVSSDHPSPRRTRLDPDPKDAVWSDEEHGQFMAELQSMVDTLDSFPCIVVWTPFMHAWGQHRSMEVGAWLMRRDPTRHVNIASGGNFWPVGHIADANSGPRPHFPFDRRFDDYLKVLGMFGDVGWVVEDHLWNATKARFGGQATVATQEQFRKSYENSIRQLGELKRKGIAGGAYIQTTDIEGHLTGLMTYDREFAKIPAGELRRIRDRFLSEEP